MHTAPRDQNGTDLIEVADKIAPGCDIKFSTDRVTQEQLNWLYNLSDCTINIAGNEGFGLVTAESVMGWNTNYCKRYRWITRPMWIQKEIY